jgi:hypothetical protein
MTTVVGPVQLREKSKDTTGPQVLSVPQFDSRITTSYGTDLTYAKIRELRDDPTISLCRQVVLAPMIHTPWTIKEEVGAPSGAKQLIEDVLFDKRDWLLQGSVYGALDFGWQPYEFVFEPVHGQIWIKDFKQLLQDFTTILIYLNSGRYAGLLNEPMTGLSVELLERESMCIALEVEGTDWYGRSVYKGLTGIQDDYNTLSETAARYDKKVAGATWVVYYPVGMTPYNGTSTDNGTIAKDLLSKLQGSGAVAVPDEIQEWVDETNDDVSKEEKGKWRIELISATGSSERSFTDRHKYLDNLKVRAFGMPERSILEGKFGTKAEAEVHGDIGLSTIDTKHRLIVNQYNRYPINTLLRLNYGQEAEGTVWIEVAPLVSAKFQTLKDVYRLLLQNPETLLQEAPNIDTDALREELAIPSKGN